MTQPYIGEVRIMSFTYAPFGWILCQGQLLPINQYQNLFGLLGNAFGGDGQTTFALPNLQGRIPIGQGGGYTMGEQLGSETVTLTGDQMPSHIHPLSADNGTPATSNVDSPSYAMLGQATGITNPGGKIFDLKPYGSAAPTVAMAANAISTVGGQPHDNMQPYLPLNYAMALQGYFPPRD